MGFAGFQPIWENPGVRERPYLKGKDGESVVKEDTRCVLASAHSHTHSASVHISRFLQYLFFSKDSHVFHDWLCVIILSYSHY